MSIRFINDKVFGLNKSKNENNNNDKTEEVTEHSFF
jgi:hypothetical protein